MQSQKNMYGVPSEFDAQIRALPALTAHRVWKQAGTRVMSAICEAAGVSYRGFEMVRIGQKNLSYASARVLQYGIFMSLGVAVDLDTLCNAINYREHQEEMERQEFEAARAVA
jgi:hypothetical protein